MKLALLATAMSAATALAAPTDNLARLPPQGQSIAESDPLWFEETLCSGPPGSCGREYPPTKNSIQKREDMSWDEVTSQAIAGHLVLPDLISDPKTGIFFKPKTARDLVGQCQALAGDLEPDAVDIEIEHHQAKCVALVWNCQSGNWNLYPYELKPTSQAAAWAEAEMQACVFGGLSITWIGGQKNKPRWGYIVRELKAQRRIAQIKGELTWTGGLDPVQDIREMGEFGEVLDGLRDEE